MADSMKALIINDTRDVEVVERPLPELVDDGLVVKIAYAGICGSDIHGYTKGPRYGGLRNGEKFGHEFVGVVVEAGKNVQDIKVGDRVWCDPAGCVADMRETCRAGGFAEYIGVINAVKDVTVFVLPDDVPFRSAALIEPFGVGVHTKNRCHVQAGDNVLMWGAGPIGLMGWAAMKHQGVENIIVAEQMPERIEFARALGADVFDNTDADVFAYAAEKFGVSNINSYERADIDRYIDYVGLGLLIGEYIENGRCDSMFSTLGLDKTPLTITPGEFMSKQLTVTGARGYTPTDIREVIETLQDKRVDIASIITGEFTLDEATAAFEAASDRNSGLKVIFNIAGE